MPAILGAPVLCSGQRIVEIVANQMHIDLPGAKHLGLLDLLLWCGNGHKDHPTHAKLRAHIGDALRVVTRRSTDKEILIRQLAHGVERPAQLV